MAAATLATIVHERRGEERAHEIATYAARISRSQLTAVLGNVLVVSIGAAAFVYLWRFIFARRFLAVDEAKPCTCSWAYSAAGQSSIRRSLA